MSPNSLSLLAYSALDAPSSLSVHLMPFRIAYDGPAHLGTYWKPREEPSTTTTADTNSQSADVNKDSTVMLDGDPQTALNSTLDSAITQMDEAELLTETQETCVSSTFDEISSGEATLVGDVAPPPTNDGRTRRISCFRGRKLHGVEIPLPEGYRGVLLSSGQAQVEKTGEKRKRGSPEKKPAKRTKSMKGPENQRTEEEDSEMLAVEDFTDEGAGKELVPTAVFDHISVWHADRTLDEAGDEYVRALDEWVRLTTLIHSV